MRPIFGFILLVALGVFLLLIQSPRSALPEELPAIDSGAAEEITVYPSVEYERIVAIKQEVKERIEAVEEEIRNLYDLSKRPYLQREIEEIKRQEEISIFEVRLEMAIEDGDAEQINALNEALDSLYYPKEAVPASNERRQVR